MAGNVGSLGYYVGCIHFEMAACVQTAVKHATGASEMTI